MARVLTWFATKRGKIFTRSCVGVAAFSAFATQLAFHGPGQEKIRELCQLYHYGKPQPISDKVQEMINDVLKDCDLKEEEKKKIQFFNVVGQDLFHSGGTNSPWGAMIGIPFYFEDSRNIKFSNLRLVGQDFVDWMIEGQDLMAALTLPERAKKFGLMREIYSCNIWDELDNAAILPFCILFPAEFARRLNMTRDAFNKLNFRKRFMFYTVCFAIGMLLYRLIKDPLKHISSQKCDERAALTGPDYLEGGIEFYEHELMKNKALRELLGKAGERQFDKNGNENYYIFAPKLPTGKRLDILKKIKETQVQKN